MLRRWAVLLAISGLCLALALGGDAARGWARYERAAIGTGQWWRLLTGHFVHLGWGHVALNLAALVTLGVLFDRILKPVEWLAVTVTAGLAISLGLLALDPDIEWYVGLSGVLHGLLAFGALRVLRQHAAVGALLLAGLAAKLAWEHWAGPVPFTESSSGGPVVVAAHLYGAAAGVAAAAVQATVRRSFGAPL